MCACAHVCPKRVASGYTQTYCKHTSKSNRRYAHVNYRLVGCVCVCIYVREREGLEHVCAIAPSPPPRFRILRTVAPTDCLMACSAQPSRKKGDAAHAGRATRRRQARRSRVARDAWGACVRTIRIYTPFRGVLAGKGCALGWDARLVNGIHVRFGPRKHRRHARCVAAGARVVKGRLLRLYICIYICMYVYVYININIYIWRVCVCARVS